jgi:RNA polymerase sigma-19 factor, ECF subfamily
MTVSPLNRDFIAGFQRGSYESVTTLYHLYYSTLVEFAEQLTLDKGVAHHIVMDALIKLVRMREKFDSSPNIHAFLYITVRNTCFTFIKSEKTDLPAGNTAWYLNEQQAANEFNEEGPRKEALAKIREEVNQLPEAYRNIFTLIFYEGLSVPAVAEHLGVTPVTVAKERNAAINLLREQLYAAGLFAVPLFVYFLAVDVSSK